MHIRLIYKLTTKLLKVKTNYKDIKTKLLKKKYIKIEKLKKFHKNMHKRAYDFSNPTPKSDNVLSGSREGTTTIKTCRTQTKQNTQKH